MSPECARRSAGLASRLAAALKRLMAESRRQWSIAEARAIHDLPIPELIFRAQTIHREHHRPDEVQLCTLLSVKTGGCQEDCGYCAQSSHYETGLAPERMISVEEVLRTAKAAKEAGASRFCMGAAWRSAKDGRAFDRVLEMVRGVRHLGLEACATLGMLEAGQAERLAEAGLTAYNHNIDTSRAFYGEVISTRSFDDRLRTLEHVFSAGIKVCSGGIIGMGESIDDRMAMLVTLSRLDPHPESVPVNALVPIEGTPLAGRAPVDALEVVRMCATARILIPNARVRLSAGRKLLSREAQLLCFTAGANSIFFGDRLLTTDNADRDADLAMLQAAGLNAG